MRTLREKEGERPILRSKDEGAENKIVFIEDRLQQQQKKQEAK